MPEFTPAQRAALSFTVLVQADAPWRDLIPHRLSFTGDGWDPLTQLFGSVAAGLGKLHIHPGEAAALGFGAIDAADAEALRVAWILLLTPADTT